MSTPKKPNNDSPQPFNEELHAWLQNHIEETELTRLDIGRRLGYKDGSTVSRYLNKTNAGDIAKFETLLRDYKHRTETLRNSASAGELWETSVLRQTHYFCDLVKSCVDIGVLHGDAGVGKTTSLKDLAQQSPTTFYVEANAIQNTARGVVNLIWSNLSDSKGLSYSRSRYKYIVDQFKGSGRLIIIDNAQRLDRSGRDIVFDFHDDTGCPIVLSGNPAIVSAIKNVDQHHSRCLLQHKVELKAEEIPGLAQLLTQRYLPHCPEVWPYAEQVLNNEGYLRSLEKVLKTAAAFRETDGLSDPLKAFRSAHAKSTRTYKLID